MTKKQVSDRDDEMMAELLRSSGRGPALNDIARARIRAEVQSAWQASLAERKAADAPTSASNRPPRNSQFLFRAMAATLVLAVASFLVYRSNQPDVVLGAAFANIEQVQGQAGIDRGGVSRRIGQDGATLARIGDQIITESSARIAMSLPSGQLLRINSDTSIAIVEPNLIELSRGSVYFDSPLELIGNEFTIVTRFGNISHVGTQYEASVSGGQLAIRVREGIAVVQREDADIEAQRGEQVELNAGGETRRTAIASNDPSWDWVEQLAIVQAPGTSSVIDILQWVSRETGVELVFDTPEARARADSVILNGLTGLSPDEVIKVIRDTTQIDCSEQNGELRVSVQ